MIMKQEIYKQHNVHGENLHECQVEDNYTMKHMVMAGSKNT